MQWFLWDEFGVVCCAQTIHNILSRRRWSRKQAQRWASERSAVLRSVWRGRQAHWHADQLVCIDESASNERTGYRKYGWSKIGAPAVKVVSCRRSKRWSILLAYTTRGYLEGTLIFQGSITLEIFNAWIEFHILPQLTPGYYVLIMDNASIYYSQVSN